MAPTFGEELDRLHESQQWAVETLGVEEAEHHLTRGRAMTIDDAALEALAILRDRDAHHIP